MVNREWPVLIFPTLLLLFSTSLVAQTGNPPPVSTVFAVLTKSLDSKSATAGQPLSLRTISEVVVNGVLVIPIGSRLLGHVTEVATKGKNEAQSVLAIVIDKAVKPDGAEIMVEAIIAAVAAPDDTALSSDPTYAMMHSNELKMTGAAPGSANSGTIPPGSKASSTAAMATANLKGRMDGHLLLKEDSQGVIGYEGLSISWHLIAPPPVTVISSKGKNARLESGTQMLLRLVPPHPDR